MASSTAPQQFHWDWHKSQSLFSAPLLKDAQVAASEKTALEAIERQIGPPDSREPTMASRDEVTRAALNAHVKFIRLRQNEKTPLEIVAEIDPFCSPTGNCSLWFFESTPHGYKLILDSIGEGFAVQRSSSNGFRDLLVNMHDSSTEQGLKIYRYAGSRYWRAACYDADWAPLENGVVHHLSEPRITPTRCY